MSILWRRFAPYVSAQWRGVTCLAGLAFTTVALEALLPWPLKIVIDHVLTGATLPSAIAWITRLPGGASASGLLLWLSFSVLSLFIAVRVVALCNSVLQTIVVGRMKYALALDVFGRLQALSLTYHRRAHKGDLLHRILADTNCLPTLISSAVLPAFTAVISLIVFFIVMWKLDALLASVSLLVAFPMLLLMRVLGPRMTERSYEQQEREGEVWAVAEQSLSSLPVVQAFGREQHEGHRFATVAGRTMHAYMRTIVTQLQFKIGVDSSQAVGTAVIMLIGGLHVYHETLSIGSLIVILSYLASLYAPLNTLAYFSSTLASAAGSARRVLQVLDSDEELAKTPHPEPLRPGKGGERGHVRIEQAVFGYRAGEPVLRRVSLEVAPGQTVALVGRTGAGKTTLVSLIPRLFDPWEGAVFLDGQDVRKAVLADVRARVAVVLQDACVLPLSITENIAYGRPGASKADIIAAAVAARADGFIRKLPRGYDTVIGERGATLSGGERQRLSIARALLKDAPVLILDEPTSALDVETERLLLEALEHLMKGRTTLIIAHRLSTIRMADRVVALEEGRLVSMSAREAWDRQAMLHAASSAMRDDPSPSIGMSA